MGHPQWILLLALGRAYATTPAGCQSVQRGFEIVRRAVPLSGAGQTTEWHPASDNLGGTADYCEPAGAPACSQPFTGTSPVSFAVPFDQAGVAEFLFSTGDCTRWVRVKPSAAIGDSYGAGSMRPIIASDVYAADPMAPPPTADSWSNTGDAKDPTITTVGRAPPSILYREDRSKEQTDAIEMYMGANVWVKYTPCSRNGNICKAAGQVCVNGGEEDFYCACRIDKVFTGMTKNAAATNCDVEECNQCVYSWDDPIEALIVAQKTPSAVHTGKTKRWCRWECVVAGTNHCRAWTFAAGVCSFYDVNFGNADYTAGGGSVILGIARVYGECNVPTKCTPATQECEDPSSTIIQDWMCICKGGLVGSPQPLAAATCSLAPSDCDEAANAQACENQDQLCYDPDETVMGNWLCLCRAGFGAGAQAAATCVPATPSVLIDECGSCALEAEATLPNTACQGSEVAHFTTMTPEQCAAECTNDAACTHFVHYIAERINVLPPPCHIAGVTCCLLLSSVTSESASPDATCGEKKPAPCEYNAATTTHECAGAGQNCTDPDWHNPGDWECICPPGMSGSPQLLAAALCFPDACLDAGNAAACEAAGQACVDAVPGQAGSWVCMCPPGTFGVGQQSAAPACVDPAKPQESDECEVCGKAAKVKTAGEVLNGTDPLQRLRDVPNMALAQCEAECTNEVLCQAFNFWVKAPASTPSCALGISCCELLSDVPTSSPPWPTPKGSYGLKEFAPCHVQNGTQVCNAAGQLCKDPDFSTPGDWLCVCPDPATAAAPLGPADCASDECTSVSVCSSAPDSQVCEDTDLTKLGTWVCVCEGGDKRGAAAGAAAKCRDLKEPVDQDECQGCAEEALVVANDRVRLGGRVDEFFDVALEECIAECQNTPACRFFSWHHHAPGHLAVCVKGVSCCVLQDAGVNDDYTAATDAVFGAKSPFAVCSTVSSSSDGVCETAGQDCRDPDKKTAGDWECHCRSSSSTQPLGPADCSSNECMNASIAGICTAAAQTCHDPDEAKLQDWLCLCNESGKAGAAVGGAAICQALSAKADVDECEQCAKDAQVTGTEKAWLGPYLSFLTGLSKEQCMEECVAYAGCEAFTFVDVAKTYKPPNPQCAPGAACCALYDAARKAPVYAEEGIIGEVMLVTPCHRGDQGMSMGVCNSAMQRCDDPDTTVAGDWLCICNDATVGAALQAAAVCKTLKAARSVDECEECATVATATLHGQEWSGGDMDVFAGLTESQCLDECTNDPACQKVTFLPVATETGAVHLCAVGASCCRIKSAAAQLGAMAAGAVSGEKMPVSACHKGTVDVCPGATPPQQCVDPDPKIPNNWECRCLDPAMGAAVPLGVAACSIDECVANAVVCEAAGQNCRDPNSNEAGDWLCECERPEIGAALAAVVTQCAAPTPQRRVDECNTCAMEASPTSDGRGKFWQGTYFKYIVGAASEQTCTAACTNTPGCTAFTWLPVASETGDPQCVRGASCCLLKDGAATVGKQVQNAVSGRVAEMTPCHVDGTGVHTCDAAGQECGDPDELVARNWVCKCPSPSMKQEALKVAECDTLPPTPQPATAVPATLAPSTGTTPAPATGVPVTAAPATMAPRTAVPSTSSPATLVPSTPAPATAAPAPPATMAPATVVPPTREPSPPIPPTNPAPTPTPGTPVPPVVLPTAAALEDLRSDVINTGGYDLVFEATNPLFAAAVRGKAVAVVVLGPKDPVPATSVPHIVVRCSQDKAAAKSGFLATHAAKATFPVARVSADGKRLTLAMKDEDYVTFSNAPEVLTVALAPELFDAPVGAAPGDQPVCSNGECIHLFHIAPETPTMPQQAALQKQAAGATLAVASASMVAPISNAGPAAGILAMSTQAMLCPQTGEDIEKLDRTLNPLGLSYGSGPYTHYNGAVVGALLIVTVLATVCAIRAIFVFLRIKEVSLGSDPMTVRIDQWFVLLQARVGWLVMPLGFLFGGAAVSSLTTLVYSHASYKVLACILLLGFVVALPVTVFMVTRSSSAWCAYARIPDPAHSRGVVQKAFWGDDEWVPKEGLRGSLTWTALHHLCFDGYKPPHKYFMSGQLGVVLLLAALSAWQPATLDECWWRTAGMTGVLFLLFVYLVIMRPYIAPYENLLEALICGLETFMLGMTLLAMGSPNPTKHWGAELAGTLGFATIWAILLKFVLDLGVFLIDEYGEWAEAQKGEATLCGFAKGLMSCSSSTRGYYQQLQTRDGALPKLFCAERPDSDGDEGVLLQDLSVPSSPPSDTPPTRLESFVVPRLAPRTEYTTSGLSLWSSASALPSTGRMEPSQARTPQHRGQVAPRHRASQYMMLSVPHDSVAQGSAGDMQASTPRRVGLRPQRSSTFVLC